MVGLLGSGHGRVMSLILLMHKSPCFLDVSDLDCTTGNLVNPNKIESRLPLLPFSCFFWSVGLLISLVLSFIQIIISVKFRFFKRENIVFRGV